MFTGTLTSKCFGTAVHLTFYYDISMFRVISILATYGRSILSGSAIEDFYVLPGFICYILNLMHMSQMSVGQR